jgi:hypothetical protein
MYFTISNITEVSERSGFKSPVAKYFLSTITFYSLELKNRTMYCMQCRIKQKITGT